ncbi:MAG: hypothetical protein N3E52_03590 [Candidatus Bathyarchaeota archaeon]|nr:hypothetical protein [Candidatus Bathyarchaeota archaeon]
MNPLKHNKGQIRTIEAVFAAFLLLSSLSLIQITQYKSEDSSDNLTIMAYNLLINLDSNGYLASAAANKNWSDLKSVMQSLIAPTVWFNLTVFDENMTRLNDVQICSGSAVADNIVSVNYLCATPTKDYAIYLINLQVAKVE